MNIFILEDQFIQQRIMEKMVRKSCEELGICCSNLIVTSKPDLLLFESKACANNLYFLDIEISGCQMKGLEVAQEIRKYDMYGHIVFVTTHGHLSPLTFQYKVAALDFIIKDATQDEMEKKVREVLAVAHQRKSVLDVNDWFILDNKFTKFQISFSSIYYFETTGVPHKIRLVSENRTLEFYGDLKDIEAKDPRLFRCHRAFIVNLMKVESIDKSKKEIIFQPNQNSGEARRIIPVSRQLLKHLLDKMGDRSLLNRPVYE
ncbi:LytTR family DNA-binding domain-containing protein [Paenibacillus sp. LX16]|uniref:LytR/AlgR family response regulator transcription factor n=1 Tax=Paenibacillus sp. LX16 TaxID=1740264 RepID=UPI002E2D6389|nr:LytTR family DNA-binding domain-containing protein [Paenibacillus sp. LX16]